MCALVSIASREEKASYFLKELKNRTAQKHLLLESNSLLTALMSTSVNNLHYYSYLHLMLGVHKNFEENIQPLIQQHHKVFKINKASVLIESDLNYLPVMMDLPRFDCFNSFHVKKSVPAALGYMYVMEGSRLGGKVIAKHLLPRLKISARHGASYLTDHNNETVSDWKLFLHNLSSYAIAGDHEQEIIEGANAAFQNIHQHFESHTSLHGF
ncbi:MAG: biliverdin-producing heme oxygenase [Flavitalea sp.]